MGRRGGLPAAAQEGYWDSRFWLPEFGVTTGTLIDSSGRLILAGRDLLIPDSINLSLGRWDGRRWETLATNLTTINAIGTATNDLVIAGRFSRVNGSTSTNISSFDGVAWHAFGDGLPGTVFALANDGSGLIAAGDFASVTNSTLTNIARWDGAQWRNIGGGVPGRVLSIAVSSNAEIFAASDGISNQVAASVWRWDGLDWTQIGDFGSAGARRVRRLAWVGNTILAALAPADSNNCLVQWQGGQWVTVGDVAMSGVAETIASGEGALWVAGALSWVRDGETNRAGVARLVDGRWVAELQGETISAVDVSAAGREVNVVGTCSDGIADKTARGVWHFDGRTWGQINNGLRYMNECSRSAVVGPRLVITGSASRPELSMGLEWDGREWQRLGVLPPQGSTLRILRELGTAGTNLFVNATVNSGTTNAAGVLARLDGTNWVAGTAAFPVSVSALAGDSGRVFAGGLISTTNGTMGTVWEWNGFTWRQLGGLFSGTQSPLIASLAEVDGALFAGGAFTGVDGVAHPYFARWDGQAWDTPGDLLDGRITALSANGHNVYAAGVFTAAGSTVLNRVAVFRNGQWNPLGGGVSFSTPTAVAAGRDGLVAVAGPRNGRVEVWVWRGETWSLIGWETSGTAPVNHLFWRGHDLHVAGGFTSLGGFVSDTYAIWHEAPAVAAVTGYGPAGFELELSGALPWHFEVRRSADLLSWERIATNCPANPAEHFVDPETAGHSTGFYRAVERP